ncbi:hypothetical protein Plhal703r1_c03g0015611 [Plasmopara halstedii]
MNSWMQSIGHRANILAIIPCLALRTPIAKSSINILDTNFAKGSTEACSYEDIASEMITSVFNSTTSPSDNSTIMLLMIHQDGVKLDSVP